MTMTTDSRSNPLLAGLALACIAALAPMSAATAQTARSAEIILSEIDTLQGPIYDGTRASDKDYRQEYVEQQRVFGKQGADLILEFWRAYPDHPRVLQLVPSRWSRLCNAQLEFNAIAEETASVMKGMPDSQLAVQAAYFAALALGVQSNFDADLTLPAVDRMIEMAPADDRAADLLMRIASIGEDDPEARVSLYRRVQQWPETQTAGFARGKIRQVEMLGKPFELTFENALTGDDVDLADLKDKLVVVDFWATWSGPCISKMPHMKELYATYRDQGVEFIGVSLDDPMQRGGLNRLQNYCFTNGIEWPQYYQGKGWDSEFSTDWGINDIPAVFVVDHGKLYSTNAAGKLDELLPELLAEER